MSNLKAIYIFKVKHHVTGLLKLKLSVNQNYNYTINVAINENILHYIVIGHTK